MSWISCFGNVDVESIVRLIENLVGHTEDGPVHNQPVLLVHLPVSQVDHIENGLLGQQMVNVS